MSRKRNKWKFSPARKRRPIGQLPFSYVNEEETGVTEESAEPGVAAEEISEAEAAGAEIVETETAAAEISETEAAGAEIVETETAAAEISETETTAAEIAEAEAAVEEISETETTAAEIAEIEFAAAETAVAEVVSVEDVAEEPAAEDLEVSDESQVNEAVEKVLKLEPEEELKEASGEVSEEELKEASGEVSEEELKETSEEVPEEELKEMPEKTSEEIPEEEPEEVLGEEPEEVLEEEPEEASAEVTGETPEEGPLPELRHVPTLDEIFGEETAAAKELPDYFFDEEDMSAEDTAEEIEPESETEETWDKSIFEEEDGISEDEPRSLYEWGQSGKKRGKKKNSKKSKKGKEKDSGTKIVRIGGLALGDGIPKICIPITGRTREQILSQAREAAAMSPDMIEWRVDYLEEAGGKRDIVDILFSLSGILGNIPLLFTYRTEGEGGNGRVGWSHYAELLEWAACRPEIDMIDVEAMGLDVDTEGLIRVIHGRGTPVIASVHYCGEMPGKKERKEALRFLKQSGGDVIKIAVTPQTEEDVLELMAWTRKQSRKMEQPLITMAMGDVGKVSRISGRLTGSAVTFGSVGEASAAGQIPAEELKKIIQQV